MFATLLLLAVPAAPVVPDPAPARTVAANDLLLLQAAGLPGEGPVLLKLLERRADPDGSLKLVDDAVARLAANDKNTFGPAQIDILGYGAVALPALQRLANRVDQPGAATRARACIGHLEASGGSTLTLAVLRAVAALRPDGVEAVLFAYLPFADSEMSFRETQQVLGNLLPPQGAIPEAYQKALKDADSIRRQTAAEILCSVHGVAAHPLVRPLLNDPKPGVRVRVALALTESYDPAAVPLLIDLIATEVPTERRRIEDALTRLAGDWSFVAPPTNDQVAGELRRALWKAWWDTLTPERLTKLFKDATHSEDDYLRWQAILARLDAPEPDVRDKAVGELVAIGPRVLPLLRQVAATGNPRERGLAAQAVTALERGQPPTRFPECAPRLLALRRPANCAQLLLDALPWMDSPSVEQQVRDVLPLVAVEDGKAASILRERLTSKLPVVRGAAVTTLARVGVADDLAKLKELLADADLSVRLKACLGLAQRGEKAALPVLIDLLATLPPDLAPEAEDYLVELAGDKVPAVGLGRTPEERAKCRDAWAAWWQTSGPKVVLADVSQRLRPRSLLLVESYDPIRRNGRVVEMDRTGRILFDISGMSYPLWADRIGTDRVLVAEQGTSKITERDAQGRVLKEWTVPSAFYCLRLRNGNTFLAGRQLLQEIDREGKVVWSYNSPNESILGVARQRDGQYAFVTYQGQFHRLDATGKMVKTQAMPIQTVGGINNAEILQGDRVLVTTSQNRIVEFDELGKIAWETNIPTPVSAHRLPRGTTLVAQSGQPKLIEIDRAGRIVQEWKDLPVKPLRGIVR